MTRQELLDLCLTFPDTYEDAPFDDPNWTVVRHRANRKCFAMLFEREGKLCINLKCEPMQAEFFRRVYVGVTPGYHMNKEHWNTVLPDSDVPTDTFYAMIQESYDRTRPKTHRVRKETPHEWETMQRAKMYIHKLAGGIDPLTDRPLPEDTVLNQPRLARCFSYVEILIERAMQQEIRSVKARRKNLPPFFLTPEQKQKVLLVHEPIPISKFAEALNAAADLECVQKIKATDLTKWLVQKGLLQEVVRNDKRHKEPTANGRAIGITSEWREALTTGAHYLSILYRYEAQQFLLDNLDSIPAE